MNLKTIISLVWKPKRIIRAYIERKLLKNISGLVHVGANIGQERKTYSSYDLDVLWIEPIPNVFQKLVKNTKKYKKQKALQALITDLDGQEYQFYIANNGGASSSILQLKHHKEMWPEVQYTDAIMLKSITLPSLFEREAIDPTKFQGLVLDTQGSELMVLEGGSSLLKHFEFIKTEVADFESYEGCCQLDDMNEFMASNGFRETYRIQFGSTKNKGMRYFNIYYVKGV